MCLCIPGKVLNLGEDSAGFLNGQVDFGGIKKVISLLCVPNVKIDDYVIVHAGIAISIVDEEEAQRIFQHFEEIDEIHRRI